MDYVGDGTQAEGGGDNFSRSSKWEEVEMINGVLKPPQITLSGWEAGVNYWWSAGTKGIFLFAGVR